MKTVVLATILATTGLAAAESYDATNPVIAPDTYYGGVNLSLGGQRAIQGAVSVDGGFRIHASTLYARGHLQTGTSGGDGAHRQARVGLEHRGCTARQGACLYVGSDVGLQRDFVHDTPWSFGGSDYQEPTIVYAYDAIAVPRIGFELGRHIKWRGGLETPLRLRLDDTEDDDDHHRVGVGLMLTTGLGFAF